MEADLDQRVQAEPGQRHRSGADRSDGEDDHADHIPAQA